MERGRQALKWNTRSEWFKIAILLLIVVGATLGGYGAFMVGMGTSSPLVVVTSYSMVPVLDRGDLLFLQGRTDGQINVGDIIVFQDTEWATNGPIVHRVIEIRDTEGTLEYITQGDANGHPDPYERTIDEIIGVVVWRIPVIGHLSLFLKTQEGIVFMVLLFIVILVVPEFVCKDEDEEELDKTPSTEEN